MFQQVPYGNALENFAEQVFSGLPLFRSYQQDLRNLAQNAQPVVIDFFAGEIPKVVNGRSDLAWRQVRQRLIIGLTLTNQ